MGVHLLHRGICRGCDTLKYLHCTTIPYALSRPPPQSSTCQTPLPGLVRTPSRGGEGSTPLPSIGWGGLAPVLVRSGTVRDAERIHMEPMPLHCPNSKLLHEEPPSGTLYKANNCIHFQLTHHLSNLRAGFTGVQRDWNNGTRVLYLYTFVHQ